LISAQECSYFVLIVKFRQRLVCSRPIPLLLGRNGSRAQCERHVGQRERHGDQFAEPSSSPRHNAMLARIKSGCRAYDAARKERRPSRSKVLTTGEFNALPAAFTAS
jgi:hypothetical protein